MTKKRMDSRSRSIPTKDEGKMKTTTGTIGNYRIIKQISEGGFGRIFQAEHVLLEEYACLKQNIHDTKQDAELLRKEAQLLWRLSDHHSIPTAKDFFLIGTNNAVMVMNYIEGKTLEEVVASNGRMYAEDACRVTERLLSAIYYCHFNGIIHSDIKPENIFVEYQKAELDIKLIDFGLAAERPNHATKPVGYTEKYAAPEIINGNPPIPETDIYGAGIVLLRSLGGSVEAKTYPKDTPPAVIAYCDRMLRYDPRERPTWEKDNPLTLLGDTRMKAFGRRHRNG
jgi:serine/threonine-protein kinase